MTSNGSSEKASAWITDANLLNQRTIARLVQQERPLAATADVDPNIVLANIVSFGQLLRDVGLPVGTGQIIAMAEAIAAVTLENREQVYFAARTAVVTRPEQIPTFDVAFARFWRQLTAMNEFAPDAMSNAVQQEESTNGVPEMNAQKRKKQAKPGSEGSDETEKIVLAVEGTDDGQGEPEDRSANPEDVMLFSAREALRKKDFAQFSAAEVAEARRVIANMTWKLGKRETRRRVKAKTGPYIDFRSTLRHSMRHGGVPISLRVQKRKERMRPLILICDISGSMDRYARLLLRFVHALEHGLDSTEVFVFGTRLTRITRELRRRDPDAAITEVVNAVDDWSGGTRIGEAIKTFNYRWSRRVLRSGATVVIISDGWDRGDPDLLAVEMARLQRSCRRLIWLNPLLGSPGYQPLTLGMKAALPFTDYFMPVHNLESLEALALLLGSMDDEPPLRRTGGKVQPNAA